MANTLISVATGNFTDSTKWGVVAVATTTMLDSEAANTALTTSYQLSSTFTPGAVTIDGIAIKVASRAAGSPSNTITVALDQGGADVGGTVVTINVSDIDACSTAQNEGGWYFFKFGAPVLLVAATLYSVKVKLSATTTAVNLYSSATTNWSRMLRTTTGATPGTGDTIHVMGDHISTSSRNSYIITMNETATTDYGPGTDSTIGLSVNKRGTLSYGVTGGINYYLKLSGDLIVYSGGTLNIGTSGAGAMPSNSSAVLEFNPVADGGMGLIVRNGGTFGAYGNPVTSTQTTLTADKAAAATVLAVADTTGWEAKELGIASTTRTPGDTEVKTISTVDSATQVTLTAGLTNAHGGGGTALVIAEVVYLYRNVTVRSATSTIMAYVYIRPTATVAVAYVYFRYLGENATGKRGIEIETTTGSCSITNCLLRDFEDGGFYVNSATTTATITLTNNSGYNLNTAAAMNMVTIGFNNSPGCTFSNNWFIGGNGQASNGTTFAFASGHCAYSNTRIAGVTTTSGRLVSPPLLLTTATVGSFNGLIIHSCSCNDAINFQSNFNVFGTFSNLSIWRNSGNGIILQQVILYLVLDTVTVFGNTTSNISDASNTSLIIWNALISRSDATFSTTSGYLIGNGASGERWLFNPVFSGTTAHTNEFSVTNGAAAMVRAVNPTFNAATVVATQGNMMFGGSIQVKEVGASTTDFRTYSRYGTVQSDTSTRHTASGMSWKLTPNNASFKLIIPGPGQFDTFKAAVNANSQVTVSAYVLKDGTYNGNLPRLVVVGGIVAGVGSWGTDSIIAMSVGTAINTWENLSINVTPTEAGVIEFYVDCDGTLGNVYVDDMAVVQP